MRSDGSVLEVEQTRRVMGPGGRGFGRRAWSSAIDGGVAVFERSVVMCMMLGNCSVSGARKVVKCRGDTRRIDCGGLRRGVGGVEEDSVVG